MARGKTLCQVVFSAEGYLPSDLSVYTINAPRVSPSLRLGATILYRGVIDTNFGLPPRVSITRQVPMGRQRSILQRRDHLCAINSELTAAGGYVHWPRKGNL